MVYAITLALLATFLATPFLLWEEAVEMEAKRLMRALDGHD